MSKLSGKIALVTGGSSGIGHATARRFVNEGAYVFIFGRRQTKLEATKAEIIFPIMIRLQQQKPLKPYLCKYLKGRSPAASPRGQRDLLISSSISSASLPKAKPGACLPKEFHSGAPCKHPSRDALCRRYGVSHKRSG